MAQNLFQKIDWGQSDAEAELARRQQLNAKVDFMNNMMQANPGNKYIQNALLEQYMGMAFPQENNPSDEIGMALDFMNSGDSSLSNLGKQMLSKNKLLQQYGYTPDTSTNSATEQSASDKMLEAFNKTYDTSSMDPTDKSFVRNVSAMEQAKANPELLKQYYNQDISPFERVQTAYNAGNMGSFPTSLDNYLYRLDPRNNPMWGLFGGYDNETRLKKAGFNL